MSTNVKRDIFTNLARIGTALSSPRRIEFLELLAQTERSVEQLATLTGTTVANTSQHLQKLRQAGLIIGRKAGLYVFYRLAGDEVVGLALGSWSSGRDLFSRGGSPYQAPLNKGRL